MAGKKNKKGTKAIKPKDNTDTAVVQRAYEDSLKESLVTYFLACSNDPKEAEENFLAGLSILRDARDRALQLVQGDSASARC
jgi:hypothetical protein